MQQQCYIHPLGEELEELVKTYQKTQSSKAAEELNKRAVKERESNSLMDNETVGERKLYEGKVMVILRLCAASDDEDEKKEKEKGKEREVGEGTGPLAAVENLFKGLFGSKK